MFYGCSRCDWTWNEWMKHIRFRNKCDVNELLLTASSRNRFCRCACARLNTTTTAAPAIGSTGCGNVFRNKTIQMSPEPVNRFTRFNRPLFCILSTIVIRSVATRDWTTTQYSSGKYIGIHIPQCLKRNADSYGFLLSSVLPLFSFWLQSLLWCVGHWMKQ